MFVSIFRVFHAFLACIVCVQRCGHVCVEKQQQSIIQTTVVVYHFYFYIVAVLFLGSFHSAAVIFEQLSVIYAIPR